MFSFKTHIHKDGEKLVTIDTKNDCMEMRTDKLSTDDITKIEEMLQQNINTVCNVLRNENSAPPQGGFQMPTHSFRKMYTVAEWLNG